MWPFAKSDSKRQGESLALCCWGSGGTGSLLEPVHCDQGRRNEDRSHSDRLMSCYRRNQAAVCVSQQETSPCEPLCLCHCSTDAQVFLFQLR